MTRPPEQKRPQAARWIIALAFTISVNASLAVAAAPISEKLLRAKSACTNDVKRFCVSYIGDRKNIINCLKEHQSEISEPCARAFNPAIAELETPPEELRHACIDDAQRICPNAIGKRELVIKCIRENVNTVSVLCSESIKKYRPEWLQGAPKESAPAAAAPSPAPARETSESKASPRPVAAEAIQMMKKGCSREIETFCPENISSPEKLLDCLKQHESSLTPVCKFLSARARP